MGAGDLEAAVALQKLAFPPPFPQEYHWDASDLAHHIELFPGGQFVAIQEGAVIGTCSNTIVPEERWQARQNWYLTVGGPELGNFDRNGSTLYGIDITVHPEHRKQGVGRAFYETRFSLVRSWNLQRYGTGCRMPDYRDFALSHPGTEIERYAEEVVAGRANDRTLTPLLRYGLRFLCVIHEYMKDLESNNAGALLEWTP